MTTRDEQTAAVVALKALSRAKSRFTEMPADLRRELAWCMALDTLTALTVAVDRVALVTDEPSAEQALLRASLTVTVIDEPPPHEGDSPRLDGLNRALAAGIATFASATTVVAVLADLPSLRPGSVREVVAQAAGSSTPVLVPDADGVGTTMLAGAPGRLVPRFGGASAERHRHTGAVDVTGLDRLIDAQRDVDDVAALGSAAHLGVGSWTTGLLRRYPQLAQRPEPEQQP